MSYHSDPTANQALGNISRDFSRLEKKAKRIRQLLDEGVISWEEVEQAQQHFRGIYRHVLTQVLTSETD